MLFMRRMITIVLGAILLSVPVVVTAAPRPTQKVAVPQLWALEAHREGPGRIPFAFTATHVGLNWVGSERLVIRYRPISVHGVPGPWHKARVAHDLESGRERSTGVLHLGRAVALEWEPVRGDFEGRIDAFYMNVSDGPVTYRTVEATQLSAGEPAIVSRAAWGADESLKSTSGGCDRDFYPVQQLFVHHTAGSNSASDFAAEMRAIYAYHTQNRGWCDVGYNFVIGPDGTIFEGRWARDYSDWESPTSENRSGEAVAGAHVGGYNSGSVGVSLMGNFEGKPPTSAARSALVELLAWESDRHELSPAASHMYSNPATGEQTFLPVIAGHRDAGSTACPGDFLYADLPQIRDDVALRVGAGRTGSSTSLSVSERKVLPGADVSVEGTLLVGGSAGAQRQVVLYRQVGGNPWRETATFQTDSSGNFSYTFTPKKTTRLEAVFEGDDFTWSSASERRRVAVQAVVLLEATGGSLRSDGVIHYPAGQEVQMSGTVDPGVSGEVVLKVFKRAPDGDERLVRSKSVKLQRGSFVTSYRIPKTGVTYRAVVWYRTDRALAAGRSNSVLFTADG
jgi:hypothetical protein